MKKPLLGTVVSVMIFVILLLAFSTLLGWPDSLQNFVFMIIVAWFVGAGVGGRLGRSSWSTVIVSILAVGLAASTVAMGVPWKLPGEKVEFLYQASFTYSGSENNMPIENVAIRFPIPNIENRTDQIYFGLTWSLYYQEADNELHLEATEREVYEFKGNRKSTLGILLFGIEPTTHGPKFYYNLDELYPREVFWIDALVITTKEDAEKVSLREFGKNQVYAYYHSPAEWKQPIHLSFWVKLSKKNDNTIESYSRVLENIPYGWIELTG